MANDIHFKLNKDNTAAVLAAFKQQCDVALEGCGMIGERFAKDIAEAKHIRDTGNLINSITHKHEQFANDVYIGTNVEYAIFQEMGTVKQKARPFLKPAVADHGNDYLNEIKKAMSVLNK